jgi:hypothetical protein
MSGRVRVTHADGRVTTGYRKTDRRNNPRRESIDSLHDRNERRGNRLLAPYKVRVAFDLPESALVADGPHGIGINVIKGFVQVAGHSSTQCFQKIKPFLSDILGHNGGVVTLQASVISIECPADKYSRWLTIDMALPAIDRRMHVAGGPEPQIY